MQADVVILTVVDIFLEAVSGFSLINRNPCRSDIESIVRVKARLESLSSIHLATLYDARRVPAQIWIALLLM